MSRKEVKEQLVALIEDLENQLDMMDATTPFGGEDGAKILTQLNEYYDILKEMPHYVGYQAF